MATIKIKGMSCQHCVGSVTKALSELPGVSNVKVDLGKGEANYDGEIAIEVVKTAISRIGFEVVG
jgi:copper chaperone CopZ